MKTTMLLGLPLALTLTAHAAYTETFESYTLGSNLHGQNGWHGWDNVPTAGAVVSDDYAYSGTQSVNITGTSDLVHEFSGVDSGFFRLSIQQYIPATATGTTYFLLLNTYNNGIHNQGDWSVQVLCNMDTGKINSDLNGTATLDMVKDAWVEFRVDCNLDTNTVDEYYNNQLLRSHPWQDGTGLNALACIDLYAGGAEPVYYDSLSIVPEPGTLSILALGGIGCVLRRRVR